MTAHAPNPPSGAHAWVFCAMWLTMNRLFPNAGDLEASEDGQAAHKLAEIAVHHPAVDLHAYIGSQLTHEGPLVTLEMVRGAQLFARDVPRNVTLYVEYTIPAGSLGPTCWGTPDLFYWRDANTLIIRDYKFGHVYVEVQYNWQLMIYALLILEICGITGLAEQSINIVFEIVQPRSYHRDGPIRTWTVRASSLRPYWNQVANAIGVAQANPTLAVTGEYCANCPGRVACEALQRSGQKIVHVTHEATPLNLPMPDAGRELTMLREARVLLDARISGLEDEITKAYELGDRTSGYAVTREPGRRYWSQPTQSVIEMGKAYGVNLAKPVEAITPTQAMADGIPEQVIKSISSRSTGAAKLVPANETFAQRAFTRG